MWFSYLLVPLVTLILSKFHNKQKMATEGIAQSRGYALGLYTLSEWLQNFFIVHSTIDRTVHPMLLNSLEQCIYAQPRWQTSDRESNTAPLTQPSRKSHRDSPASEWIRARLFCQKKHIEVTPHFRSEQLLLFPLPGSLSNTCRIHHNIFYICYSDGQKSGYLFNP